MGWPGPMTYRQFQAWQWWEVEDLNTPGRTDHYLMVLLHQVKYLMAKTSPPFSSEDYRIPFVRMTQDGEVVYGGSYSSPGGTELPAEGAVGGETLDELVERANEADPYEYPPDSPLINPPPLVTREMILKVEREDRRWEIEQAILASKESRG